MAESGGRQLKPGAQAPLGRRFEVETTLIKMGEIGDDREPKARPRLALIKALPSFHAYSQLGLGEARPIIIDDDREARRSIHAFGVDLDPRPRPLAGIVEQVADHLLEILLLPLELEARTCAHDEIKPALSIDAIKGALQRLEDLVDVGDVADHARPRRNPRPIEMVRDLDAHDLGLLHDLVGQRPLMRSGLVADHAQRSLERMGEIADMGARPIDDLAVGLDQRVQLLL